MTLPEEQDSLYPFESAPDKALGSRVLGVLRKWVNEKGFRRIMRFCSTVQYLCLLLVRRRSCRTGTVSKQIPAPITGFPFSRRCRGALHVCMPS